MSFSILAELDIFSFTVCWLYVCCFHNVVFLHHILIAHFVILISCFWQTYSSFRHESCCVHETLFWISYWSSLHKTYSNWCMPTYNLYFSYLLRTSILFLEIHKIHVNSVQIFRFFVNFLKKDCLVLEFHCPCMSYLVIHPLVPRKLLPSSRTQMPFCSSMDLSHISCCHDSLYPFYSSFEWTTSSPSKV